MRCQTTAYRIFQFRNKAPFLFQSSQASHSLCQLQPELKKRCPLGIAFDIDGVVLRGRVPIGGSPQALRRLYGHSGALKVPFLFLTNGGGIPESRRASELSELLGVNILPPQVLQGHSPFKNLLTRYMYMCLYFKLILPTLAIRINTNTTYLCRCTHLSDPTITVYRETTLHQIDRFENELIIATGKGEPALVMSEYGFKKVLSLDEYASYFENIDPVSQYKRWTMGQISNRNSHSLLGYNISSERVKGAFVVSDPVDWGRDIQVLCDILRSRGLPGQANGQQPPLYFAADDLEYQAAFPSQRLGMGAFRIALESIFNRIHNRPLEYVSYGKPNPFVFRNAEAILSQFLPSFVDDNGDAGSRSFKTLYMIGDNPMVDVKGAKQAGHPWFSILTRTGIFKGVDNHAEFPADLVVDTVEEAVEYILKRECIS